MIPHIHTLFEFISIPYENQHQTLNIKKIDRGQIRFRDYRITLLQPLYGVTSMRFTCVSVSVKTALRFPWNGVTMHAFHTLVCIYYDGFRVFLVIGCFTRLSASSKTAFAFFFVLNYNAPVSHACLHRLRRLLRFPWYGVTMHAFNTRVCIG